MGDVEITVGDLYEHEHVGEVFEEGEVSEAGLADDEDVYDSLEQEAKLEAEDKQDEKEEEAFAKAKLNKESSVKQTKVASLEQEGEKAHSIEKSSSKTKQLEEQSPVADSKGKKKMKKFERK